MTSAVEDLVHLQVDDVGVATLTLDDPQERNGWSPEMEAQYFARLDHCAEEPGVRVVVLTGAGRTFCPGLAMSRLQGVASAGLDLSTRRPQFTPRLFPKPIIGAINGACAGIGLVQALQCDVRFAAAGAKFTTAFVRRGLTGEYNLAWTISRLAGLEIALDLVLSGRVITAEEALRLRLVSRVLPPDEVLTAAQDYARDMAVNCSPTAMAVIRAQAYADLSDGFTEALEHSYAAMAVLNAHPDLAEGVASYRERRSPNFAALPAGFDAAAVAGLPADPFPSPPGPSS